MEKILELIKDEVCMGTYGNVELELRKLVEEKFTSTNTASDAIALWKEYSVALHDGTGAIKFLYDNSDRIDAVIAQQHT